MRLLAIMLLLVICNYSKAQNMDNIYSFINKTIPLSIKDHKTVSYDRDVFLIKVVVLNV